MQNVHFSVSHELFPNNMINGLVRVYIAKKYLKKTGLEKYKLEDKDFEMELKILIF